MMVLRSMLDHVVHTRPAAHVLISTNRHAAHIRRDLSSATAPRTRVRAFDHSTTGFALTGAHTPEQCAQCP